MSDTHHKESFFRKYLFSTDHKIIAMQYLFTGMFMGLVGGFMVYVFRMQLAFPGIDVPGFGMVSETAYNALVTNHGSIMIFWYSLITNGAKCKRTIDSKPIAATSSNLSLFVLLILVSAST